ncbi:MAG: T9SS type A sorting domain-containing protein [bacterium]
MNQIIFLFLNLFLFIILTAKISIAQNLLNQPESAEYDYKKERYLISNYGDGNIIQIDKDGNQSYFDTTLTQICALHIVGDTLYVASSKEPYVGVVGYNLSTDQLILFIGIPGNGLLNDITSDLSGNLYVTDYYDSKIYKLNTGDLDCSILTGSKLNMPNGIVFDNENNRIITHSNNEIHYPIKTVNPQTGEVNFLVNTNLGSLDGLVFDNAGYFYFSTWVNNSIYRYDKYFQNPPDKISSGHDGPADIFFNKYKSEIAVPNFYSNTVDIIPITTTSINEKSANIKNCNLYSLNYPNPFNAETNIMYHLKESSRVKIDIYNSIGERIQNLIDRDQAVGEHIVKWNANSFPSGHYFYSITGNNFTFYQGMLLIK